MLTTNGIAVTASITTSDGHDALSEEEAVGDERNVTGPRARRGPACLRSALSWPTDYGGETREWLGIAGLVHDGVLAGLHRRP